MAFQFSIATPPVYNLKFKDVLTNLGLTTNLKLVLDAGDAASVAAGSQTKWLDVSGNGYDFFRGTDATVETSDPTFNGTVGGQSASEYYSLSSDLFTYDSANEAWMTALHGNNATFTLVAWVYCAALGGLDQSAGGIIFSTITSLASGGTGNGVEITFSAAPTSQVGMGLLVTQAGSVFSYTQTATPVLGWNFMALSVNEAADSLVARTNATVSAAACTYSSPSGAGTDPAKIGRGYGGAREMHPGSRIASLSMWQGAALTAANLESIYQNTRGKFGV